MSFVSAAAPYGKLTDPLGLVSTCPDLEYSQLI